MYGLTFLVILNQMLVNPAMAVDCPSNCDQQISFDKVRSFKCTNQSASEICTINIKIDYQSQTINIQTSTGEGIFVPPAFRYLTVKQSIELNLGTHARTAEIQYNCLNQECTSPLTFINDKIAQFTPDGLFDSKQMWADLDALLYDRTPLSAGSTRTYDCESRQCSSTTPDAMMCYYFMVLSVARSLDRTCTSAKDDAPWISVGFGFSEPTLPFIEPGAIIQFACNRSKCNSNATRDAVLRTLYHYGVYTTVKAVI